MNVGAKHELQRGPVTVLCPLSLRVGTKVLPAPEVLCLCSEPLHTPLVPRSVNCARSEPVS